MKCHICGHEIIQGKKYCPGCGRVVRLNDANEKKTDGVSSDTMKFSRPITPPNKTSVYRPAASKSSEPTQKTIHIPDIFSSDPNAPEYTDPHAYDKATAHVLEYDRMFVSRSSDSEKQKNTTDAYYSDDRTKHFDPVSASGKAYGKNIIIEQEPIEDDGYYDDDSYDSEEENYDSRNSVTNKKAGPHINIKAIIICIAVIVGITICVTGVYQIGKQFGFWATEGSSNVSAENDSDKNELHANQEPKSEENEENANSNYKTGVYTIKSDQKNIFVYKSASDQRIIATIPNGTVIEITEIKDELGKTTYNSYTGWVELAELEYTPDQKPDEEKTTKEEPQSEEAAADFPTKPGTYTVTLSGSTPLNVRDSNSTSGAVIGTLTNGTEVEVLEVKSSWGKISIDGKEGWVYMEYLK